MVAPPAVAAGMRNALSAPWAVKASGVPCPEYGSAQLSWPPRSGRTVGFKPPASMPNSVMPLTTGCSRNHHCNYAGADPLDFLGSNDTAKAWCRAEQYNEISAGS